MGGSSNCDMGRDKNKTLQTYHFLGLPNSSMSDIFLYLLKPNFLTDTGEYILFFIAASLKSCRALLVATLADISIGIFILIHLVLPSRL